MGRISRNGRFGGLQLILTTSQMRLRLVSPHQWTQVLWNNELKGKSFFKPDLEPTNDGLEWAEVLQYPELLSDVDPFGDYFCSVVSWLVIIPVCRARHQHSGYHTKGNGVELKKKMQAILNDKIKLFIICESAISQPTQQKSWHKSAKSSLNLEFRRVTKSNFC